MSLFVIISMAGRARGKGAGRAMNTRKGPRVFAEPKTRTYESQLRYAAEQAMRGRPPTNMPCSVRIEARVAMPKDWSKAKREAALRGKVKVITKPDCNNYSKIFDACNMIVWKDDRQIFEENVRKVYSETPGLTVVVETVEQWVPEPRVATKRSAKKTAIPSTQSAGAAA